MKKPNSEVKALLQKLRFIADEDPKADLLLSPYQKHTIIGPYTWLRPIYPQDWDGMIPILGDPLKMQYFGAGRILTDDEIKSRIAFQAKRNTEFADDISLGLTKEKGFNWAFFNYKGFSGRITVFLSEDDGRLEIAFCGQGGTAKAAKLVLDYMEDKQFLATVHPRNSASVKVLKEIGFTADESRRGIVKYGSHRDYYLLNRSEGISSVNKSHSSCDFM